MRSNIAKNKMNEYSISSPDSKRVPVSLMPNTRTPGTPSPSPPPPPPPPKWTCVRYQPLCHRKLWEILNMQQCKCSHENTGTQCSSCNRPQCAGCTYDEEAMVGSFDAFHLGIISCPVVWTCVRSRPQFHMFKGIADSYSISVLLMSAP
jgi:hypothetical protein